MSTPPTGEPHGGVLSDYDWSPQSSLANSAAVYGCIVLSLAGILLALFLAVFAPTMAAISAGSTVASVAFLVGARNLIVKHHEVQESLETIFHISTAHWEPDTTVTLFAAHGARWRRVILQRPAAVYFFRLRPTLKHLKQQDLAGAKADVRFLYEMEPRPALNLYYQRGAASMVHHNVTVRVVSRQVVSLD